MCSVVDLSVFVIDLSAKIRYEVDRAAKEHALEIWGPVKRS